MDVSDPTAPAVAGWLETPEGAIDVFVSDNYAFVAGDTVGLVIIDVGDAGVSR